MPSRFLLLLMVLYTAACAAPPAQAADLTPTPNHADCRMLLSGPIESGDYRTFVTLASKVFDEDPPESTANNTICLDSPGGSLVEGMKLSQHFFEHGIGTVIDRDAVCFSACALMFMMGRAEGPEVSFINRRLHIQGLLGFHRPSLHLPDAEGFNSRDIAESYDLAVTSVVDYLVLANKRAPWSDRAMVGQDLVEQIFATAGDDLYIIDTVEKAARWQIELIGVRYPETIDEERAYLACENTLQWETGLHEEPLNFVSITLASWGPGYAERLDAENGQQFNITSRKAGYANAGCVVSYVDKRLRICAEDQYTGVRIGSVPCEASNAQGYGWANRLSLWRPETPLPSLNDPWVPTVLSGTCEVRSAAGSLSDRETCSATISYGISEDNSGAQLFTWPSGSRTVVEYLESSYWLNSDAARLQYVDGYDTCIENQRTGNTFCFTAASK